VRVCREIVCFTGRRDSFNFENRLARERRNRGASSARFVGRRWSPGIATGGFVRSTARFLETRPVSGKAPRARARDARPRADPETAAPPTRSAELARAFAPGASRADGARVSAARASADSGHPRDCVQSAPSIMPTALLMQQSGPQAGPQGQSKTVTVTITGASRAPSRGPTAPLPNPARARLRVRVTLINN
jgi:hypothetical protein